MIVFGGKGEKNLVLKDIHAFDPMTMTWFQGPEGSGSPCARFGHSGSIINNNQMLVFGGWNMDSFFNDIYLLNLQTMCWYKPETKGACECPNRRPPAESEIPALGGCHQKHDPHPRRVLYR